ncbi:unnamed protein product [Rhodiola kirilowii]
MSCNGDETLREVEVEVDEGDACDGPMVRWERFFPRVSFRVLLVESDDSSRQVIAALLRKCSYKVAAVSDGLKAWEVLKGTPNGIDLILTEMELPSISGFALLTLIMEHDSCKNIPVIMMSSNDSVNMVYKCMMRGAADFLVKPVRRNELQNLWQHVWRRQASASSRQGVPDESITQQKVEGLLDNDLPITLSNGACTRENEECNDKGNDALSNTYAEASDNNDAIINGSGEVRDLIGTFQNHSTKSGINLSETTGTSENDSCPRLDLSLRRYDDSRAYQDTTVDERRHVLHQSNASAFSRYKSIQPVPHKQTRAQPREHEGSSDKHMSSSVQPNSFYNSISRLDTQKSSVCQASSELVEGEFPLSAPQLRMFPVTVQVKGVRLDHTCTSYCSSFHPSHYNQTGATSTPSPESAGQREFLSRIMQVPDPNVSSCSNQTAPMQDRNLDTMEHMRNASYANERSQNSSLCNGALSRLNSFGCGSACGSNGSGNPVTECKADGTLMQDENTNRSLQREAALTKFRQKRKDRCFEKKVRYESRKKLAEQRPRVKGQFVRQVPTNPSITPRAGI